MHKLLRMDNNWYTDSVVHVLKGAAKKSAHVRKKVARHSREVRDMVKLVTDADPELAALKVIAWIYML